MNIFRLIKDEPATGAWNMAVDEAIFESVSRGESLPTVRFYAWEPACLSLGYSQSAGDVDESRLKSKGWHWVRRLTGGKAILHVDEITYSIVAPINHELVAGTLLESYMRIASGLLEALKLLGIKGELNENASLVNSRQTGPICFEVPSAYEITVQGKKILGSAQSRRANAVLQHGTLPLHGDLGRIVQVLEIKKMHEQKVALDKLMKHATTVETELNRKVGWEESAGAFETGFTRKLGISFQLGKINEHEFNRVQVLLETKYQNTDWIKRV